MKLVTERLILRPIKLEDKHVILDYRSDEEANKYQGWIPKTLEDVEEFIAKLSPKPNLPGSWFQLAILEKESGRIIGDLGIHFLEEEIQQVELGYTLNKNYQGKGYATEALKSAINYLFIEQKKHRITASVDPGNLPSCKLLERLDFRKEAHLIESLCFNGKWVDDVIYAMLAREWDAIKN